MPKIKTLIAYPIPDLKLSEQAIHEDMRKFNIRQLRKWVLAVTKDIPVWSGAAKASFLFLAAKALTSISINPRAPSRISLGISEADADVIEDKNAGVYGWVWKSDLAHIGIVDDRVKFLDKGEAALKDLPNLPHPVMKTERG